MGTPKQYALIAFLAEKEGKSGRLGKKAAQKFMHILSSVSGKSNGYRFSFYTYGAFSSSLASDLDIANSLGLIDISYNSTENSYSIKPTSESSLFFVKHLSDDDRKEAEEIWNEFSGKSARDLELISTILFLYDEESLRATDSQMTDRVLELKPKYTKTEVLSCQKALAKLYSLE